MPKIDVKWVKQFKKSLLYNENDNINFYENYNCLLLYLFLEIQ